SALTWRTSSPNVPRRAPTSRRSSLVSCRVILRGPTAAHRRCLAKSTWANGGGSGDAASRKRPLSGHHRFGYLLAAQFGLAVLVPFIAGDRPSPGLGVRVGRAAPTPLVSLR